MRSLVRLLADRPVLAAVLGALTIAGSAVCVSLADVPPSPPPSSAAPTRFRRSPCWPGTSAAATGRGRRARSRLAWFAGVFFAADLILWHHAINQVGAGLATVLGNTQVVVVPLGRVALPRERPSARVAFSVPVVLVGVVLISGVIGSGAYGENPLLGVILGLVTGLAYGGFILVQRGANADQRRPAGPLFDATLSTAVITLAVGLPLGEIDLVPTWPAHGWLLVLALGIQVCRLAAHQHQPAAPAGGHHVGRAHHPAGRIGPARDLDPVGGAVGAPAARRRLHHRGPAARHPARARSPVAAEAQPEPG